jgi:L-threonylcarbamoyladenylate synthase
MYKIDLSGAIAALQGGDIIVYPTDTLYALGADVYNEAAVRRVFKVKKRPLNDPLPMAVSDFDVVEEIAFVNDNVRRLAECFLPGSLTLVLNKKSIISDVITGGLDKVAVRIPDNDVALKLLSMFGPLTVTSANVHGMETPGFIGDIKMQFNVDDVAVYLDYGKLDGMPSTIVDMTAKKPRIVREGIITERAILDVI